MGKHGGILGYVELLKDVIERQNLLIHAATKMNERLELLEKRQLATSESLNKMADVLMAHVIKTALDVEAKT